ncbi:MAG TPA: alpha/beta hydrolase-fold protein [Candidatus Polarisedimenticolaceae bacterium]|nr:alpha/beta hydrolase-fold protein [Candidatus Polarisedimenticolaceae bacterium]
MHREYHRWHSPSLGRDMELLWYGNWGRPLLAFPTSLGSCSQNEDNGLIGALADKIEGGELQICCVDAIDSECWYNDNAHPGWKIHRYMQYDRYLTTEVVPLIHKKAERDDLMTFGASFGGYHAMNFAGRHPELVSRVISFSGIYGIHRFLHGFWNDDCYFNCPDAYYPNLPLDQVDRMRHIGFVVATGEQDHLVQENRWFSEMLRGKGLNVYAEFWPGVFGHDWPYWRENLKRFVP